MTKAELVSFIAGETKAAKKTVDAVLNSLVDAVQQTLKKGGEIRISSLGTFKVVQRKARTGVNPQTKAKIKIPARKAPKSARLPISCVLTAEASTMPKTTASTALLGLGRSSPSCPIQLGRFGLMTKSMSTTKINTKPRLRVTTPTLVA